MKQIFLAITIMLGLLLCGCAEDLESTTGGIAGSVSDKTTGEPVATANVTLSPGGESTVTGSDGSFSFQNLANGTYTISIAKEGYKSVEYGVYVRSGEQTSTHLQIERIPATITPDRDILDFGAESGVTTLSFAIVNKDYTNLDYTIEYDCPWIKSVKPNTGTLASGKTETIVVSIDRSQADKGDNTTVLVIKTSNGRAEITVKAVNEHQLPQLNVYAATNIGSSFATLKGEIINSGTPSYTERGFVYSTSSNPTIETTLAKLTVPVSSTATFSYSLSGLTLGKTYYVRAYAKNSVGVAYSSNQVSFTTVAILPEVTTENATGVDSDNGIASLNGKIVSSGEPGYTERGFVYSLVHNPTIYDNKIIANGTGVVGEYSVYATNLPKNKTYYVRAYATNEAGTSYGNEIEIKYNTEWIELPDFGIAVQKNDLGKCDWHTAKSLCENSRLGGYSDWRLPTKEELLFIYNNQGLVGGFTTKSYLGSSYWTRNQILANGYYHYYAISFDNGVLSYYEYDSNCRVRAVRTLTK